jgi:transketolase
VVTAEQHQLGGFGNILGGAILENQQNFQLPLLLDRIGAPDCSGFSGKPWELMQRFGLTAEHIAERVLKLHGKRATANRLAA